MKNNMNFSPTKTLAGLAILASILSTTKDSLAQTVANNGSNKATIENTTGVASNANALAYSDPLTFTLQNIGTYFPDQQSINQAHFLIERLGKGTIRKQVNQLITENIVNNISDPKQQIWTILYGLEQYIFSSDEEVENIFSKNNQSREANNYRSALKFRTAFDQRFKDNTEQMLKDIEKLDKDIEQGKKTLEEHRIKVENMMKFITPDMIKTDPNIKKIVENRKKRYELGNETPKNGHIISLFAALK